MELHYGKFVLGGSPHVLEDIHRTCMEPLPEHMHAATRQHRILGKWFINVFLLIHDMTFLNIKLLLDT